jgi:hypothetical protein
MREKDYNRKMAHLETRLGLAKTQKERETIAHEITRLESYVDKWGLDDWSPLDNYLEEAQAGIL